MDCADIALMVNVAPDARRFLGIWLVRIAMAGACRIALTGAPGTGKSTLALEIQRRGFEVESVEGLAEKYECIEDADPSDGARPIDVGKLCRALESEWLAELSDELFIEGHLSHSLPVDASIILRCSPLILEERLAARGYSNEKVSANVDWEILGGPWNEIGGSFPCLEIDASSESTDVIIGKIVEWMADGFKPMDPDSSIDWVTEEERRHV